MTSQEWIGHFERNAAALIEIPWGDGAQLSPEERRAVARSIQIFQLGESSEGRHLLDRARDHARSSGDLDYPEAMRVFIKEEGRHAGTLARFLDLEGIPRLRKTWSDSVFRSLRKAAGLEVSVAVLIVAEIIAIPYYEALQAATHSTVLRTICDQILLDEAAHVRFQSERLAILRAGRPRALRWAAAAAHRLLFSGACAVVWLDHRSVFRAAGWSARRFWSACQYEYRSTLGPAAKARAAVAAPAKQRSF